MFINSDPKDHVYRDLIDLAFDTCDEFILVVRKDPGLLLSNNGNAWLINIAHEHESYIKTDNKEELDKIMNIDGLDLKL